MNPDHGQPQAGDPLLQRYHEANALDAARPDPALRERVLAQARAQATLNAQSTAVRPTREAANDGAWKLRALGSLAVLGLVGLLALQFDRGSPEEREVVFGSAPRPPASRAEVQPTPPSPSPSSEQAVAPPPTAPVASQPPSPVARQEPPAPAAPLSPSQPPQAAPMAEPPLPAPAAEPPAITAAERARAPAEPAEPGSPALADAPATAQAPAAPAAARAMARMASPTVAGATDSDALDLTPLMRAAARGDSARVEQLLAAGADLSARDRRGWTAADHARQAGHEALARRLAPPPAAPGPTER